MLVACGGDTRPTTEEFVRDVQERALGDFNAGLRGICESRSLSRIVGSVGDEACECALRVAREQLTDDELVVAITDEIPLPEAVEERAVEICGKPDSG